MTTALITGANRGIGLELTRQLAARGTKVIAACRTPSKDLQQLDVRIEADVDVSDDAAVGRLAERLGDTSLDLVLLNAGILSHERIEALDFDAVRRQFEVNSLGPLRVLARVLPKLAEGAKVALITSRMGSIADNTSGGAYGYRMSKAALNAAGKSLAIDLAPRGISVVLLHPGFVRTEMTGGNGMIDAPEAATGILARLDALTAATSGQFLHMNGDPLPW
jgi:NAD(P)-dependent dehydrogenase (short-subunit alcohol dehydrogenase family)